MFVKESQVLPLDEHGKPMQIQTPSKELPPSKIARSRQSV